MLKQLVTFIEKASLFVTCMSGFRKGHSTTTTLLGIQDDLKHFMNIGKVSLLVFADYPEAFDTVQVSTALRKMHRLWN